VDREVDKLEEVALEQRLLVVRRCDLGKVMEVEEMWGWMRAAGLPPLWVLVNNAGVGGCRGLLDSSGEELLAMAQVNLVAPTLCCRHAHSVVEPTVTACHGEPH